MKLGLQLYDDARPARRGLVLAPGCGVILGESTMVEPDLLYVVRERRHIISDYVRGAPDLIGEVISRTSTEIDGVFKRKLYARYGVTYYWIVEPFEEWIRAYELGADGQYELVAEAHGNVTFSAPPFADLQIDLAALWADPLARS